MTIAVLAGLILLGLIGVAIWDLRQRRHAILRNFPVIGHVRYLLEAIGPELRQYIVTGNNEELPFSRDQRRWVYASAKSENSYFGYGTDSDLERSSGHLIIKHETLAHGPLPPADWIAGDVLPCAKILGGARGRARRFRPSSLVNVSGMSLGALSGPAVRALNRGAALRAACTTPARAGSPSITSRAAS